jgi:hypothetical protein
MEKLFYEKGLRFTCLRCSKCCRESPGYVFLSKKDLHLVSKACKKNVDEVIEKYCKIVHFNQITRLSLIEKVNFDCIFWEANGCAIYANRPLQCRSFPFWSANLESDQTWENVKLSCPGTGQGELHSQRTIQYWLDQRQKETFLTEKDIKLE